MNINLDSLLAGNRQKNAQKRQEEVVVVDSETETVTDDERNAPKKVDSGSNKANTNEVVIESTDELDETPNNETENIKNNAMEVTETETPNKDNKTGNMENNAVEVTETEEPKDNETENTENNAVEVTETEEPKDNKTENTENNAMDVAAAEANRENETDNTETENNEQNVPATEAKKDNETDKTVPENNAMDKSSDKDVTDTEANKDNKTGNTGPEDNSMDVNPTEQNDEKGMENGASNNTDTEQNKENKDRKAKPGELKEKDPILEAFCNVQSQEDLEILLADYNQKKLGTSKVSETDIKTQNGTVNVKQYCLLKSPIRKDRSSACTECNVKKTTIAELTKHIKEAHPGYKHKCSQCERLFDTYNGHTKHENKHYLLKYACVFCLKRFQFLKRLNEHLFLHTDVGGYKCPSRSCKSVVTSKDNLKIHMQIHDLKEYPCDQCEKVFHSSSSLHQHKLGVHGNGTISLCGAFYRWPDSKNKHQADCPQCIAEKKRLLNKEWNPRHVKKEQRCLKAVSAN